jgi:hypothetical protein
MDLVTLAPLGLTTAGLAVYLFQHWWRPPGPEAGPPLLAM